MRDVRYYLNQALIKTAYWCLSKVKFMSYVNNQHLKEGQAAVKNLFQCI